MRHELQQMRIPREFIGLDPEDLQGKINGAILGYLYPTSRLNKTVSNAAVVFGLGAVTAGVLTYVGVMPPVIGTIFSFGLAAATANNVDVVLRRSYDPSKVKEWVKIRRDDYGDEVCNAVNAMSNQEIEERVDLLISQVKEENGGKFTTEAILRTIDGRVATPVTNVPAYVTQVAETATVSPDLSDQPGVRYPQATQIGGLRNRNLGGRLDNN